MRVWLWHKALNHTISTIHVESLEYDYLISFVIRVNLMYLLVTPTYDKTTYDFKIHFMNYD